MKKGLWICSLWLLAAACTNNTDNTKATAKEEQTDNIPEGDETGMLLQNHFPLLLNFFQKNNAAFSTDSVIQTESATQQSVAPYPIDPDQLNLFKPLLIYNPDSTKAIDLFSYNYIITNKNGTTTAEAAEPDSEVALMDFKNGKRQRLWFSGPAATLLDAAWINQQQIAIAGMQEKEDGQRHPAVWIVSLPDSTIDTYLYQQPADITTTEYLNQRFPEIKFH